MIELSAARTEARDMELASTKWVITILLVTTMSLHNSIETREPIILDYS